MELDIGEIIRFEFEKSGLSIAQFARMINKERSLVYHLFKRRSIDTDLLYRICIVLNIDFFRLFSEKLEVENKIIAARSGKKETESKGQKRKVLIEIELDESEYNDFLQKHC